MTVPLHFENLGAMLLKELDPRPYYAALRQKQQKPRRPDERTPLRKEVYRTMDDTMLTTVDNPFSPHTQFREWYTYDVNKGYNTLGLLARIVKSSPNLSEADQDLAIQNAMDEIVEENVLGVHRKVSKNDTAPADLK